MKTIKRNILAVALLVSLLSNANTNENIFLDVKKVTVEFLSVKEGNTLTIKDEFNSIIYKENIKKSGGLLRTFDFSELPEGNYLMELEKDFEIIKKPFRVAEGTVTFTANKEVIFKPVLRTESNRIFLSKFAFSETKMDVEIYFEGELIHKENLKGAKSLSRIYQLSTVKKGDYTVVVAADGKSYTKNFNL